ncbi:MAG: serine/threonine protein kinase [Gemmataceae bacterium]|nr:serine/threonine protein kinase [Gemmataceae bacterium]
MNPVRAKPDSVAADADGATSAHRAAADDSASTESAADDSAQQFAATAAFAPGDTIETRVAPPSEEASVFGRYVLQRLIGQGGMGEVHLAQDTLLKRTVALKIPKFADDAQIHRDRFLREARSAALLTHSNICPVYDVGEVDGRPYLTMAYVDGPSLAARLHKSGPLDPYDAARLVGRLAVAMQHAHEQGVLHRDLKPGNILINSHGEPVVMDFGLAFRFDAETSDRLTEQGLVVGTPAYMPPEQVNGQTLGPAADVYSLGVVLFEALTGKVPFEGPLGKLLAQIDSAAPPPPTTLRPDLEPALEAICLRALAKRPADRFADMAELAGALDDYARGKATLTHLAAPTMMFRRPRRHRWAFAAAGALALAATAITAAVLWMRRAEPVVPEGPPSDPFKEAVRVQMLAMGLPVLKIEYRVGPMENSKISRKSLPRHLLRRKEGGLLKDHDGALYFLIKGSGAGHELDLTDQPAQGCQITDFTAGDFTVYNSYLTFLGRLDPSARIYLKSGPAYSVLAPMNGGAGCRHVEFDGTHLLLPKIEQPAVAIVDASADEIAGLRDRSLTKKVTFHYPQTEYTIYARPHIEVVPGNHDERREKFPDIYTLIEYDRLRQTPATTVREAAVMEAVEAARKQ